MTEKIRKPIGKRKKLPQFTIMNVIEGQAGLENYSSLFFYSLTIDNILNIIVLLILAGVALSLTVGDNGLFKRAENAVATWQMAEQNEHGEMDKAGDLIDDYANNIIRIDEVPIPDGFYYAGGNKETGLIISDNPADRKEWNETTATDVVLTNLKGNQFVWVPVENPRELFKDEEVQLNGVETKTNIYSNLTIRSGDSYMSVKPGDESSVREPDVLSRYDTNAQYYDEILGFDSTKAMADSFVSEYKAMSDSIKKYNGFYIGRYELTANGEKTGESLTDNWYNLYKACQNVITGKNNVRSTMIYGVQWDAVCSWLRQNGFDTDSDSSSWGNYRNSSGNAAIEGAGTKQDTGFSEYWKANNIYDLAGNCWEWTQEANSSDARIFRGSSYDNSGSINPASCRNYRNSNYLNNYHSSRATLYML